MINKHIIKKEQAIYAIENGEFGTDIIASKNKVIITLTQDWCPQWVDMKSWIYEFELEEDIEIYELEYNRVDYFNEFMTFKENHWKNHNVPYLRYYKEGKLIKDTNYISKSRFIDIIKDL
jgi:hypothetical protein